MDDKWQKPEPQGSRRSYSTKTKNYKNPKKPSRETAYGLPGATAVAYSRPRTAGSEHSAPASPCFTILHCISHPRIPSLSLIFHPVPGLVSDLSSFICLLLVPLTGTPNQVQSLLFKETTIPPFS